MMTNFYVGVYISRIRQYIHSECSHVEHRMNKATFMLFIYFYDLWKLQTVFLQFTFIVRVTSILQIELYAVNYYN